MKYEHSVDKHRAQVEAAVQRGLSRLGYSHSGPGCFKYTVHEEPVTLGDVYILRVSILVEFDEFIPADPECCCHPTSGDSTVWIRSEYCRAHEPKKEESE